MTTFLEETAKAIHKSYQNLADLVLILPSKRASAFLRYYLLKEITETTFSPKILSIEEFIEELSDLKIVDQTELIFKAYKVYREDKKKGDHEEFDSFASWGITLLNDFSEIDRYLLDTNSFFSYLSSIQTLNKWNVQDEKTELIENYLQFWQELPQLYVKLNESLLKEGIGYQGMVYRKASEDIEHYIAHSGSKNHVFIGFNALNSAEQSIIQALLETERTEIFWDVEQHFLEDTTHGASLFVRRYLKNWNYYQNNSLKTISNHFTQPKKFRFVEAQKNISQAKYLGNLLSNYSDDQLNNTAVVLGDETLLIPVLHSLPSQVKKANVTMGTPVKNFNATQFFDDLIRLHANTSSQFYFRPLLQLLNHPLAILWIPEAKKIASGIVKENLTYLSLQDMTSIVGTNSEEALMHLFSTWKTGDEALRHLDWLFVQLSELKEKSSSIDRLIWSKIHGLFKKLNVLNYKYQSINAIKTLHRLYQELVATSTVDFAGDAYEGLQIMGVLETRCLDFENIILLSANEGIFPSGKSNASFITYDLKKEFDLPLYTHKDAIYTYHFYKMMHRAKSVTFIYNGHAEGLNEGERSRFLSQLEFQGEPNHSIEKVVISPQIKTSPAKLRKIEKTDALLKRLKEIAAKGFSPSSLTSYIRNPIEFYTKKVLQVYEFEEVEEIVAYNTLGTIVHDTLQSFYEPFINELLSAKKLSTLLNRIDEEVRIQFKNSYGAGEFNKGKNLIIFEVAKQYVKNLIGLDISELKQGNEIRILAIEDDLKTKINVPKLNFPIFLIGKVDRIDSYNGQTRIIDYKTGNVTQTELNVREWLLINEEYKYSKAFQVLAYSLMWDQRTPQSSLEAGIISFKNLKSGFMKFNDKSENSRSGNTTIDRDTLEKFEPLLHSLILEIFDPNLPFIEKEI